MFAHCNTSKDTDTGSFSRLTTLALALVLALALESALALALAFASPVVWDWDWCWLCMDTDTDIDTTTAIALCAHFALSPLRTETCLCSTPVGWVIHRFTETTNRALPYLDCLILTAIYAMNMMGPFVNPFSLLRNSYVIPSLMGGRVCMGVASFMILFKSYTATLPYLEFRFFVGPQVRPNPHFACGSWQLAFGI